MLPLLRVESDFKDYYDNLTVSKAAVTYRRFTSDNLPRDKVFRRLLGLNVKTVPFGQVKELAGQYTKLVVYTDITKHNREGKVVLQGSEALLLYPNKLASAYLDRVEAVTYKVLCIGKRMLRLVLEDESIDGKTVELPKGKVKNIEIVKYDFESLIREPIFSIDYIPTADGLVAVDFNSVENLGKLGINKVIDGEYVVKEVYEHLIKYG